MAGVATTTASHEFLICYGRQRVRCRDYSRRQKPGRRIKWPASISRGDGTDAVHGEKPAAPASPGGRHFRQRLRRAGQGRRSKERPMKTTGIQASGKLLCCLILVLALSAGCTYQRRHSFKPVGMPEEVYISTSLGNYYTPDIAVFSFRSDGFDGQVGKKASRLLCSQMLKYGVNASIVFKDKADAMTSDELARFAWENRYDYIITGDVLRFLNGGHSTQSRVEEEIKIYSVSGKDLQVVGYAKAVETVAPKPETDFYLVTGRAASAPSAELLMERNAGKFARLLAGMFNVNGTPPEI